MDWQHVPRAWSSSRKTDDLREIINFYFFSNKLCTVVYKQTQWHDDRTTRGARGSATGKNCTSTPGTLTPPPRPPPAFYRPNSQLLEDGRDDPMSETDVNMFVM